MAKKRRRRDSQSDTNQGYTNGIEDDSVLRARVSKGRAGTTMLSWLATAKPPAGSSSPGSESHGQMNRLVGGELIPTTLSKKKTRVRPVEPRSSTTVLQSSTASPAGPQSSTPLPSYIALKSDSEDESAPDLGPPLCQEQEDLVNLILSGRNVFYTGSAGCGKSTVLKAFVSRLQAKGKRVRILAPTGIAALQVGGTTWWAYAGLNPNALKQRFGELMAQAHGKKTWRRLNETDVLVVDEISMMENHHFERLNAFMKQGRHNPNFEEQPAFGGVQMVVTGDFCQLPPVNPFKHCITCGEERKQDKSRPPYRCRTCQTTYHDKDKWAFQSKAWKECNFAHVELKTIHRQKDEAFIRMLQKCRLGEPFKPAEIDILMGEPDDVTGATKLHADKESVKRINGGEFDKLRGDPHRYECLDTFEPKGGPSSKLRKKYEELAYTNEKRSRPVLKALEEHQFGGVVRLKKGMLVVLQVNLDLDHQLCNGSMGTIVDFVPYREDKMPRANKKRATDRDGHNVKILYGDYAELRVQQMKAFMQAEVCEDRKGQDARGNMDGAKQTIAVSHRVWPDVLFHNGERRVIRAECFVAEVGDEKPYSLLCRTQIPLAPAWAMTIHKSQGQTMDRVVVDLSKIFEAGQMYVALSRARALSGLKIEGSRAALEKISTSKIGVDKAVQAFMTEHFGTAESSNAGVDVGEVDGVEEHGDDLDDWDAIDDADLRALNIP